MMNTESLISYIKTVIADRCDGSQQRFAKENGFSPAYLSDVLTGRREPGKKILEAVGVERVTLYKKIDHIN